MYQEFYGLTGDPFTLGSTGQSCLHHASYTRALSYLKYALLKEEGLVLLTAEPGMGKTSLIAETQRKLQNSRINLTCLTCSPMDGDDLLRFIARAYDIKWNTANKTAMLAGIESVLADMKVQQKRHSVLILDESQTLPLEALEQVRLLTNLNWLGRPLLQVVLVGHPALRQTVLAPGMEQLHQRIIASASLEPLDVNEVRAYVEHRLSAAGYRENPQIETSCYRHLHHYSEGIPRWINLIMSRLLLHGMVEQRVALGTEDLLQVLHDLISEDLLPRQARTQPGDDLPDSDQAARWSGS